jgi:protein-disulfide isomerase
MECVKKQDPEAGWKVYEKMFEDQKSLTVDNIKAKTLEYAGADKIDKTKFDECYDKKETLAKVRADKAEASTLGISGTPSFVVNGRLVKGAQPADKFKAVIDDELASSK